jgi:hypothetical protein
VVLDVVVVIVMVVVTEVVVVAEVVVVVAVGFGLVIVVTGCHSDMLPVRHAAILTCPHSDTFLVPPFQMCSTKK